MMVNQIFGLEPKTLKLDPRYAGGAARRVVLGIFGGAGAEGETRRSVDLTATEAWKDMTRIGVTIPK